MWVNLMQITKTTSTSYGGYLKDIPQPHKRMHPNKQQKRRVTFQILTWIGWDPSAKHYFSKLIEEPNFIYNSKTKMWVHAWDDKECYGKTFQRAFTNMKKARKWAIDTYRDKFSPETHYLMDDGATEIKLRWSYKTGD